jgi:hypothetical protein
VIKGKTGVNSLSNAQRNRQLARGNLDEMANAMRIFAER